MLFRKNSSAARVLLLLGLIFGVILLFGAPRARAQGDDPNGDAPDSQQECTSDPTFYLVLQPNEVRELPVFGFCLQRFRNFPGPELVIAGPLSKEVQTAVRYIVENGYNESMPELYSAQLAIWTLIDGRRVNRPEQKLADEIVAYAEKHANDPPECVIAPSMDLPDAVAVGLVEVAIKNYRDISPPNHWFYGEGTLTVTNLTDEVQVLNVPYGVRFADPSNRARQDTGVFIQQGVPSDNPPPPPSPGTGAILPPEFMAALFSAAGAIPLAVYRRKRMKRKEDAA